MVAKLLKYGGIAVIIAFCIFSTLIHQLGRELSVSERIATDHPSYASYMEDRFYDMRMRHALDPKAQDNRIVLAAIDDISLRTIGRWPWTRTRWAEFMHKMQVYGAKVVAFDVFYPEPEVACNAESPDELFAKTISTFQEQQGHHVIIPYSMNVDEFPTENDFEEVPEALYNFIMDSQAAAGFNLRRHHVSRDAYPIQVI